MTLFTNIEEVLATVLRQSKKDTKEEWIND